MEKISNYFQKLLNTLYTDKEAMIYFYIILGVIALIFIILIIVTSIKGNKEKEEKDVPVIDEHLKEEPTPAISDIVTNNEIIEGTHIESVIEEKEEVHTEPFIEPNPVVNAFEPVAEEVVEEPKEITTEEIEDSSITEIEPIVFEERAVDPIIDGATIEIPKMRPLELDELPDVPKEEIVEVKEEPKEEVKTNPNEIVFNEDVLKERLAKLKAKQKNRVEDKSLDDIMRSVGLEDTMVIPGVENEENKLLGK